jgi:hypothetical protein
MADPDAQIEAMKLTKAIVDSLDSTTRDVLATLADQGVIQAWIRNNLASEVETIVSGDLETYLEEAQGEGTLTPAIASLLASKSGAGQGDGSRETSEIRQVRKNIAGYAAAMGRGAVDPVISPKAFPPDSTTTLAADPLSDRQVSPMQIVSLRGHNLQRVTEVRVDGNTALIVSMAENELRFMVPAETEQLKTKPKEVYVKVYVGKNEISDELTLYIEPATVASQTGGR